MENQPKANFNNSNLPDHITSSTSNSQDKISLKLLKSLILLVIAIIFGVTGFYFGSRNSKIRDTSTQLLSPTPIVPSNNNQICMESLLPVVRNKTKNNYDDFLLYKDDSGFSLYYPKDWFVSEGGSQVQNWNPNNAGRPLPLSGKEAKWDLSFDEKPYSYFGEIFCQSDSSNNLWDKLEVSYTTMGWPIYFAYKEVTEPMGSPYLMALIITPDKKLLTLHGFFGSAIGLNIEVLKQIAESIQK